MREIRRIKKILKSDDLVKSHIPYVVHASTKPVLSEPSTLRQAQGERWVEALRANGGSKRSARTEYQ